MISYDVYRDKLAQESAKRIAAIYAKYKGAVQKDAAVELVLTDLMDKIHQRDWYSKG